MATQFSNTLVGQSTTDADFRAWCQFIHDLLVNVGGWVNTSDTGQVDLTTVTKPTAANQKRGYKIYRMNDALQPTAPVFMRIDFGSGKLAATAPGIWITIGTGTDGAGTITGIVYNGGAASLAAPQGAGTASVTNSYGSADPGRVVFSLFVNTSSGQPQMTFALERTVDASGQRTGAGLLLWWNDDVNWALSKGQYVDLAGGSQPPTESGVSYALSSANPSSFGSDVGVGVPIPFRGIAQQPGTQVAVVRSNDFVAESQFQMSLYGVTRTYQHLRNRNAAVAASGGITLDNASVVCIEYD